MDEIIKPLEMIVNDPSIWGSLKIGTALVLNGIATSPGIKEYISKFIEDQHDAFYYSWVVGR
jgi:hypothetical protein